MPELPEVEVTRLSFVDRIKGATVLSCRMGKPLRWPLGCAPTQLVGWQIANVRRRGKYLLLDLEGKSGQSPADEMDDGLARSLLMVHLGMSGSLTFAGGMPLAGAHDHFDLVTTRGTLRLNDPRRFGAVVHAPSEGSPHAQKLLGKLGMEPLSDGSENGFDLHAFYLGLQARTTAVKQVLLAGDVVVGVGNIYASEALFRAGIRPTLRANKISRPRAAKLHTAIRQILARAVERGGTTLRDFSNADGQAGHFQLETCVYGRAGEPCKLCNSAVKSIRQGQRSTFFCPKCQKY